MVPTRRLLLLVVVAALPFAAAAIIPGLQTLGWIADLGLLALLVADLALTPRARSLSAEINVDRIASLGSPETVRVELRNSGGAQGPSFARLAVPDTWAGAEDPVRFELPARGAVDLHFSPAPRKRGRYLLGPVHVRYPSLFGLFLRDAVCAAPAEVKVYPAVGSIKQYQLLVRRLRLREMGFRPHRLRGQGMEFARLREFQPDDDPRLIDWKATARRGRLISREFQVERCQNIMLLIDAGRMLTEEVDGLTKIEYALHGALLLARVASEYDDRVGAMVFSDKVERTCLPMKGRAAVPALAEALFDVEPRLCESDYDAAFQRLQTVSRKRALVVLFTNVVDQESSALVTAYLAGAARRHVVLLVAVGDRETRAIADSIPAREEDAYLKAAACRLLASRAATLEALRKKGVQVIDAASGQVPMALVNRYLDLKARQAI
jgi:uncharacterized protein (DUF58 family)